MPHTFSASDSALVAELYALSGLSPKLVRSSTYKAPADPEVTVTSWKMNEFKYYEVPSPFPTLARGLFTVQLPPEERKEKRYRIVARGYDKFFNIGEVPWTTWSAITTHTRAPYTLSLKSNGCIIFISALTPDKLLITSKHSLGPGLNALAPGSTEKPTHAQAGERWLRKYLQEKGRTEAQMARRLWEENLTAIAELCDDSFEEHVLPYPPSKTGLHLHGLNTSTKTFHTLPAASVDAFAEEWGFIPTRTITFSTTAEVQEFTDTIGKQGHWDGEAVEGFVVRTHVGEPVKEASGKGKSPYDVGCTFFFKIKFDEPYMMYRDWREITKVLLSGYARARKVPGLDTLPKNKMKRPETKLYARWVSAEIARDPAAFEGFAQGHGIIGARERYFAWMEAQGEKTVDQLLKENVLPGLVETPAKGKGKGKGKEEGEEKWDKTIIVPVGVPGCGKTAVSLALARLFGFAHTQSDDVQTGKKAGKMFLKNVMNLLEKNDVVIADKNNHLKQHRQALRTATITPKRSRDRPKSHPPRTRLLALNWDLPLAGTAHDICAARILARGANHQTLPADAQSGKHEDVLWMFLNTREALVEAEVDGVVDMKLEEGLEEAVRRAVDGVVGVLGVPRPSEERVGEVVKEVKAYKVEERKQKRKEEEGGGGAQEEGGKKKLRPPRYFALLPEVDLIPLLDALLVEPDAPPEIRSFWDALKQAKRVAPQPHVTIVHSRAKDEEHAVWSACEAFLAPQEQPALEASLGRVLCDGRVMALTVEGLQVPDGETGGAKEAGKRFLAAMPGEVVERLHITVGTRDREIKPVEAKALVQVWRRGKEVLRVNLPPGVTVRGRVKGMMG